MMSQSKVPASAHAFQPNEFYERLLIVKRDDPEQYERSFSTATKLALDAYEREAGRVTRGRPCSRTL